MEWTLHYFILPNKRSFSFGQSKPHEHSTSANKGNQVPLRKRESLALSGVGLIIQYNYEIRCHFAIPLQVAQRHQGHILGNDENKVFLIKSQISQVPYISGTQNIQQADFQSKCPGFQTTVQLVSCISLGKYFNICICTLVSSTVK